MQGVAAPKARAHHLGGTTSPAHAVVGAQGGPAGGSSSQGPGTPAGGDWGPAQEVVGAQGGPAGGSSSQGAGTPVWGHGKSCPGGGRCSRSACGGQRLPRPGHTSLGGRGVLPRRRSVMREGLRGHQPPTARAHLPWGAHGPAQAAANVWGAPSGGGSLLRRALAGRGVIRPFPVGGGCCDASWPAPHTHFGVGLPHQ